MRYCFVAVALVGALFAQDTFQTKCNPSGNFGTKTQFDSKCPSDGRTC